MGKGFHKMISTNMNTRVAANKSRVRSSLPRHATLVTAVVGLSQHHIVDGVGEGTQPGDGSQPAGDQFRGRWIDWA